MKTFFPIAFIFSAYLLSGQNNSFEIYGSANYSDFSKSLIDYDAVVSYNFGVGYNYGLNKKVHLTAGLRFADYVNEYSNDDLRWGTQHNGQGGHDPTIPDPGDITGVTFKYHYYFMEMPVGIKYYLLDRKTKIFIEPTFNPSLFLTRRTDVDKRYGNGDEESQISSDEYSSLRKFNVFGEMGVGLQFPLSKKMELQIRTGGRMQLMDAVNNSGAGSRLYSVAAKIGFVYLLKEE